MTIKEIAQLAGVSISTVSKIVNNKDQNIHPETRSRVLKIVKEYNYTPYGTVKNLSNAKSFLLAVLLRSSDFSPLLLNGILETAQEHGYNVLLFDSQADLQTELKHITTICQKRADGVIWEPVSRDSTAYVQQLTRQKIPVCYLNAGNTFPSYTIDFQEMGRRLTQKMIDHKHTRMLCLLEREDPRSEQVVTGFRKCLYDNGLPFHENALLYDDALTESSKFLQKLTELDITGIVSSRFSSSLFLYEQLCKLHYCVPADLSLVSLKEDGQNALSFPHISGITIPWQEFGSYICRQLIRKCEKLDPEDSHEPFASDFCFDSEDSIRIPSALCSKKLIVVGSINSDMTLHVDFLPQAGKTTKILNATRTVGGKGANQAVGIAKLNCEVTLIGEIGNDIDSSFIMDTLNHVGVPSDGIHRDLYAPAGKAYIYIDSNGESTITVLPGANSSLSAEMIRQRQHLFKNAGLCLLSSELSVEALLEAAKTSRMYGAKNILKPAVLGTIPDQLYALTDILIPNRKEAVSLCPAGASVEEQAAYFLGKGIKIVIITLDEDGCYLKTRETARYFPAADFVAVDTTGGADAFISAFAAYLTEGYSLEHSIRIATYAAGFCVSRQGAAPVLADRSTLEAHIGKFEPALLQRF